MAQNGANMKVREFSLRVSLQERVTLLSYFYRAQAELQATESVSPGLKEKVVKLLSLTGGARQHLRSNRNQTSQRRSGSDTRIGFLARVRQRAVMIMVRFLPIKFITMSDNS